ncbi:MAG: RDD family protein [Streptosporangiaceae bacterium]
MRCWRPEENSVPGWGWMALRNFIGTFIIERLIWIIGVISFILMCVNKDRKSLHDLISGTIVVHDPNKVLQPPSA